jgi:hypothetical protein
MNHSLYTCTASGLTRIVCEEYHSINYKKMYFRQIYFLLNTRLNTIIFILYNILIIK